MFLDYVKRERENHHGGSQTAVADQIETAQRIFFILPLNGIAAYPSPPTPTISTLCLVFAVAS